MQHAITRKKQQRIHSALLNKIAFMGQAKFAALMGVHESRVSRWKNGLLEQVSLMLAVLEWGIEDDDLRRLAKGVVSLLKKEASEVGTFEA